MRERQSLSISASRRLVENQVGGRNLPQGVYMATTARRAPSSHCRGIEEEGRDMQSRLI